MNARTGDGQSSLLPIASTALRTELVADAIRRAILEGALRPGQRLVERELAAQLEVSKTPVREALKELAQRGLVSTNAYRGMTVRKIDARIVRQIYELRALLEPEAVRQATPAHDATSLANIRAALDAASAAATEENLVELTFANRHFHEALYRPCHNALLRSLLDDLRDQVALISVAGWRQRNTWSDEAAEHLRILEAVESGDADAAAKRMRAHIEHSLTSLVGSLDEEPSGETPVRAVDDLRTASA